MARLWQQIIKGEKGQALVVVLGLLVIGGLLIAPALSYASTSLNAGLIIEKQVRGVYAADAAVEYVLWQITNGIPPPDEQPLPENVNVNQMEVIVQTDDRGTFSLYFGELIVVDERPQGQEHYKWLTVEGEAVLEDEELQIYRYTITVTWQPEEEEGGGGNCNLDEVGVRLPVGYSYEPGSTAGFEDNLSTGEPDDPIEQDGAGAHMLNWALPGPTELLGAQTVTQAFYVTGAGDQEGDYTWVGAVRQDVGQVGDIIGTFYRITARATRPGDGEITSKVIADVIEYEETGEISIIFWQATPR